MSTLPYGREWEGRGPLQRAGALGHWHQLLAIDVVDAEGLDDEAVGEERTEGKRTNGTFNIDIKERDGNGCKNDADFLHLTHSIHAECA